MPEIINKPFGYRKANPRTLLVPGTWPTPNTPSPATVGRYLILYAYYYGQGTRLTDQVVLTISPAPNYGRVAYPLFQAGGIFNSTFYPFWPQATMPGNTGRVAEELSYTVVGNNSFNGLAAWGGPLRLLALDNDNAADQFVVLSIDTLLNNTPQSAFPPGSEPVLTLTINSTHHDNLYFNMFVMCATVTSIYKFQFFGDYLGLITNDANGNVGELYNDATMGGVNVPPGLVTRTEYDTDTIYTPQVYSETSGSNPFVDVSAFLSPGDTIRTVTLGMNSLRFNV